jgi:hypothetical protein
MRLLRWLIKVMREFFLFCSLNIISWEHNLTLNLMENTFSSSPQKLLGQLKPNLVTIVLGWFPFQISSGRSGSDPRWLPAGKLIFHRTRWGNTFKDLLRTKYWINWNRISSQCSVDGPLSKLRPGGLCPNQHDRQGELKLTLDPLEKHIQRSSLQPRCKLESNLVTIVLGWSPFTIVSGKSGWDPRWWQEVNIY